MKRKRKRIPLDQDLERSEALKAALAAQDADVLIDLYLAEVLAPRRGHRPRKPAQLALPLGQKRKPGAGEPGPAGPGGWTGRPLR